MKRRIFVAIPLALVLAGFLVWRFGYHGIPPKLIFFPPDESSFPAALDEIASIDVADQPFRQIIASLADRFDIALEIDAASLADLGLSGDELVSLEVEDVTLRSLLALLARRAHHSLTLAERNGGAVVASNLNVRLQVDHYQGQTHSLTPLLTAPDAIDSDALAEAMATIIAPRTWERVGGPGEMHATPGALVVSQTLEVQRTVGQLITVVAHAAHHRDHTAPIPLLDAPQFAAQRRIQQSLAQPVEIDYELTPLVDVAADLERRFGIEIVLDVQALAEVGIADSAPITAQASHLSLRSALNHVLDQPDLVAVTCDEVLLISTPEVAESRLNVVVYPVHDLAALSPSDGVEGLIETIETTVAPSSWDAVGGPGSLVGLGGAIVVAQTDETHRDIEALLNMLRRSHTSNAIAIAPPGSKIGDPIEQALQQRISLDVRNAPLGDLIKVIAQEQNTPIVLDSTALQDAGCNVTAPVSLTVVDARLEDVLWRLFEPYQLAVTVRDEAVVITLPHKAEADLERRCFCIGALAVVTGAAPQTTGAGDVAGLEKLITTIVAPDSWDSVGGPGSITTFGNTLVVSQTRERLQEVERLLGGLLWLRRNREHLEAVALVDDDFAQTDPVLAALQRPIKLEFHETTVRDIAHWLTKNCGANVQIDENALGELRLDSTDKLTANVEAMPLAHALRTMLNDSGMTIGTRRGAICITAGDQWVEPVTTRLYPIRDLLDGCDPAHCQQELVEAIVECVAPDSWDEVGGQGQIDVYRRETLIVSQRLAAHETIAGLLAALRAVRQRPADATPHTVMDFGAASRRRAADRIEQAINQDPAQLAGMADQLKRQFDRTFAAIHPGKWQVGIDDGSFGGGVGWSVPLDVALSYLYQEEKLPFISSRGELTAPDHHSPTPLEVRVYPVGDLAALVRSRLQVDPLLAAEPSPESFYGRRVSGGQAFWEIHAQNQGIDSSDRDGVDDLVRQFSAGDSWRINGGNGAVMPFGELLVVRQTPLGHQQVGRFLARLRSRLIGDDEGAAGAEQVLLEQSVDLRCSGLPLAKAIGRLAEAHRLPVWLDERELLDIGVVLDAPVNCNVAGAPLGEAIRGLSPASQELDAYVEHGVLVVSSKAAVERRPLERLYDLQPILAAYPEWSAADVQRIVTNVAAPRSRKSNNGPIVGVLESLLIVREPQQRHNVIKDLLAMLLDAPADLPRPYELARDDNRAAIVTLLAAFEEADDPIKSAYAAALLADVRELNAEDADRLVKLFWRDGDAGRNNQWQRHVLEILSRCNAVDTKSIAFLRTVVDSLDDVPRPYVLAELLLQLREETRDLALGAIWLIDPQLDRSNEILQKWGNSTDANMRTIAEQLGAMLSQQRLSIQ